MARSRPNPYHTFDFRFELIRKPRMMRPTISEVGRWVTLETPRLKPIHKPEYKYGYNPYFSRMTRTQRRRWIRQQATLRQEFGKRDHYLSRSTTDSDSMEVITGAKAPEYLRGPYAGKEDITGATTKNIATPIINSTSHKVQNTETKPCQNKDLMRTQNNHKRLEKNSENAESKTESEEAKNFTNTSRATKRPSGTCLVWQKEKKPEGWEGSRR